MMNLPYLDYMPFSLSLVLVLMDFLIHLDFVPSVFSGLSYLFLMLKHFPFYLLDDDVCGCVDLYILTFVILPGF